MHFAPIYIKSFVKDNFRRVEDVSKCLSSNVYLNFEVFPSLADIKFHIYIFTTFIYVVGFKLRIK